MAYSLIEQLKHYGYWGVLSLWVLLS